MTPSDSAARGGRRLPRLHAVTDDEVIASDGWIERAVDALEAGGAALALHLRGPRTDARRLLALAEALLPHARGCGAALLVNDRVDVALVAPLDGVHLGSRSLPPGAARPLLGSGRWIGVSCHGPSEVESAVREGADYVFLGTIFATASHPDGAPIGPGGLEKAVAVAGTTPVVGIGGIGPGEVEAVIGSGAWGVAVVRGIWSASDPGAAVKQYLEVLGE